MTNTLYKKVLYNYGHAVTVKQVNRGYNTKRSRKLQAEGLTPWFIPARAPSVNNVLSPKELRIVTKETLRNKVAVIAKFFYKQ